MNVHPHGGLVAFVTGLALVEKAEVVANDVTRPSRTQFRGGTRGFYGRTRRYQLSKRRGVNVRSVADPPLAVPESEHVVGVDESEHSGRVHQKAAGHVPRVPHRIGPLVAGEGERV